MSKYILTSELTVSYKSCIVFISRCVYYHVAFIMYVVMVIMSWIKCRECISYIGNLMPCFKNANYQNKYRMWLNECEQEPGILIAASNVHGLKNLSKPIFILWLSSRQSSAIKHTSLQ